MILSGLQDEMATRTQSEQGEPFVPPSTFAIVERVLFRLTRCHSMLLRKSLLRAFHKSHGNRADFEMIVWYQA